ncbi:hypothetical protein [Pseudarthrobacter sp. LMD1-1-1.1]|uniref:hypothetical protein n=1 Tax=Pseudarthrobacter sp. LMD1-1-1.1 TaxID=3135242 RepID=UPI0034243CEC
MEGAVLVSASIESQCPSEESLEDGRQHGQNTYRTPTNSVRHEIEAKQNGESDGNNPSFGVY